VTAAPPPTDSTRVRRWPVAFSSCTG
jgi:hypothetical protein